MAAGSVLTPTLQELALAEAIILAPPPWSHIRLLARSRGRNVDQPPIRVQRLV